MKEQAMGNQQKAKQSIQDGKVYLGIELGSTRIKSVLIDAEHTPVASGSYNWENTYADGIWTYPLDQVWEGLQASYKALADSVEKTLNVTISHIESVGISAMMHGYLVFDKTGKQLVPFRTWRNTTTEQAAKELTEAFQFNIPQRWSIAHLYQAMLNKEDHIKEIDYITTLAGYVHWQLTGEKVVGVGEASGMFPIESTCKTYNKNMLSTFKTMTSSYKTGWTLEAILPKVLPAGTIGGHLTKAGAQRLDPTGNLKSGALLCPPEGDAGTGMVATNSVTERTGNISAGTSVFAMSVLEKPLSKVYEEIDMVTTPSGKPVAMVHCNNCTSDLDAWAQVFDSFASAAGVKLDTSELYTLLYQKALEGEADCGGLLSYNYFAGEPISGFEEGRPLFVRMPDSRFTLENFTRSLLLSTMGTLKLGMDILTENEGVQLDQMLGHGGFFKVEGVGQRLMAAALSVPITVMESAGEGGAWGIALLAAYSASRKEGETLEQYLSSHVFCANSGMRISPNTEDQAGFEVFMQRYVKGLAIEKAAVDHLL